MTLPLVGPLLDNIILILSFREAWTCPGQISGTTWQNFMKLGGVIDICFVVKGVKAIFSRTIPPKFGCNFPRGFWREDYNVKCWRMDDRRRTKSDGNSSHGLKARWAKKKGALDSLTQVIKLNRKKGDDILIVHCCFSIKNKSKWAQILTAATW
jgi:hypothetical protein